MIELFCAWGFLLYGLLYNKPLWCIAAGVFAIAFHLGDMKQKG